MNKNTHNKEVIRAGEAIVYLENGEPIKDFPYKGSRVPLAELVEGAPTGMALIKFANGFGLAINRRVIVFLEPPDQDNRFTKGSYTRGIEVSDHFPEGLPDLTIGEGWPGSREPIQPIQRVMFRTKYAYNPAETPVGSSSPALDSLFDSAEEILKDFERSRLQ